MPATNIAQGPTGKTVAENVSRLMKARGLTTQGLSDRLSKLGRPIPATGITKIVQKKSPRRVYVDDLMALALALDVTPLTLLLPGENLGARQSVTGDERIAGLYWDWALGNGPLGAGLDDEDAWLDYQRHAIPQGYRKMQALMRTAQASAGVGQSNSRKTSGK